MGRPKNFKREDVIQKAMEIFWLKGYSATSLSDLTEATGLNKKSLYNEFGNKQELFKISLDAYRNIKKHQIEILMSQPLGKNNVIRYLENLGESSNIKGCLISLSIYENEHLEKGDKLDVSKDFKGLRKLIFQNLEIDYDEQKSKRLELLVSSFMFSIAGLGKLKIEKSEIKSMIEELITLFED